MGNLKGTTVYTCGPIQYAKSPNLWRDELDAKLKELGIICLSPLAKIFLNQINESSEDLVNLKEMMQGGQYDKVSNLMKLIIRRDLGIVDRSDFVIANIDPSVNTIGSIHEIVIASLQRKPILFLTPRKEDFPLWLLGLINHNLIFESIDELFNYLKELNDGPIENLDAKYWKILTPEFR